MWWLLTTNEILGILQILNDCKITPYTTMHSISRYIFTNIHTINEEMLLLMIQNLKELDYIDTNIEKSLEKYIKTRGVKIKDASLIVEIMNYCQSHQLRSMHILNGVSEYFILNCQKIRPEHMKEILQPFGLLDYQPINSIKFWQVVEQYLDENFSKIPACDIIDIMLTCVYLERYPLNFVKRIFNSYFLDLLHATTPPHRLQRIRGNLKLFDFSLTLECLDYAGPFLPRDHTAKQIWQDGRIKRVVNNISANLEEVAGGETNFTKSVILFQLPVNDLFIVDVLLHPSGMTNTWNISILSKERNLNTAVLVHLPEHFDSTGHYLTGPQVMRIRQFRILGLKVVTLKYQVLMKLKIYPKELNVYLKDCMKNAIEAY